ncbi:MAG: DUF1801 domain-containing protein [Caldilinea sp.]
MASAAGISSRWMVRAKKPSYSEKLGFWLLAYLRRRVLEKSFGSDGGTMNTEQPAPKTIDEYIAGFSPEVQTILQTLRATIRAAAPDATETINYQMPTFTLHGNLVHFAAFKQHIGLYPAPSGIEKFQQALSSYKGAKGSVQFPLDQPIPYDLVSEIVKFRVAENLARAAAKKTAKRKPK